MREIVESQFERENHVVESAVLDLHGAHGVFLKDVVFVNAVHLDFKRRDRMK